MEKEKRVQTKSYKLNFYSEDEEVYDKMISTARKLRYSTRSFIIMCIEEKIKELEKED